MVVLIADAHRVHPAPISTFAPDEPPDDAPSKLVHARAGSSLMLYASPAAAEQRLTLLCPARM